MYIAIYLLNIKKKILLNCYILNDYKEGKRKNNNKINVFKL